jgi:uncharacterized membrane protein
MAQQNKDMNVVGGNALSMRILRFYLWAVPFVMILASLVFGAIAAADSRWGLFAVMVMIGVIGLGLLAVHYWLLYRFGKGAGQ